MTSGRSKIVLQIKDNSFHHHRTPKFPQTLEIIHHQSSPIASSSPNPFNPSNPNSSLNSDSTPSWTIRVLSARNPWSGSPTGHAATASCAPPASQGSDSYWTIDGVAMGDYTRMINFSTLPSELREGKVGRYWYHEDMQAFFDDMDQYKMIKAMCKLSCSLCDKADEQQTDGNQRRRRFRNIDQLKGHLYNQHNLHMCSLFLRGKKVFICEQKLYTRAQLDQHIRTGDSEVDGTESERGGFMGHARCEFCRTPFYGDNELYTHMTIEHYTCHICQRQNLGQFEYYRNYDDLETHFGQAHFLCEDEACLAKQFVVFQSEAELKRHNALEHGGHMSRSKRNAALQIPTSFRYRSKNDAGARCGRGQGSFCRDSSPDNQLTMAINASLETAGMDGTRPRPPITEFPEVSEAGNADPLIQPFES
ncbi:E3 ubiquitin-protein ligase hel2-like protein [Drosera capensis]